MAPTHVVIIEQLFDVIINILCTIVMVQKPLDSIT